ncbi:hypothetical protein NI389_09395 [Pseudoalteromonas xiamenensis]|uniref:hypothetical protein n=1 Tax=Pseudoalteromonas xiamenensis TaxID=882626 RepID=UPI0027E517EB|nr:hypothetical protein [Pseudoalteromonas xiamenensis]WMN58481.1 hypothetical protein NI389_09395 [Pseudoalteromonas xiamenensis]
MPKGITVIHERNAVVRYLFQEKYDACEIFMSKITGYSKSQIQKWLIGEVIPSKYTLDILTMCVYTPEFTVVEEFFEIDQTEPIKTQLNTMYKGHEDRSGVYAFYDSLATLLYVGKATNLLRETYSALMREDVVEFPSGIANKPLKRFNLVKYISAYDVGLNGHWDYPKHVESLILRISKPTLNKQIGVLEKAYPVEVD